MIVYIGIFIVGIIIGAIIITICNIITKKSNDKQYLEDYREIIKECLYCENKQDDVKKKESTRG